MTTLVLVPGLLNDATVWAGQVPALERHARVAVGLRMGGEESLPAMAATLLERFPGPLAIAGHSMGGRVALEAARQAPGRVAGLALLDTGYLALPAGAAGELEAARRHALLELARQQGMRAMLREWVRGMVAPDRLADAALVEAIIGMMVRSSPDDFARQVGALLARPDASDVLRGFKGPVLVACGALDAWSPPSQHEEMARLAADARLEVIPGAGHMAPMEAPEAVAGLLAAWLARVQRAAGD